jgi:peptidoglycan/LPS O-acetylase OafA/YrhL
MLTGVEEEKDIHHRLAAIDGLRAIAMLMVLVCHAALWSGLKNPVLAAGGTGVDLFMVISGFCLTWPLVRGRSKIKALNLASYVRRRCKRILPPFYAAIVVYCAAAYPAWRWGHSVGFPVQSIFPMNWRRELPNFATHFFLVHGFWNRYAHALDGAFWSMSLEWQFYMLLPLLVLIARRASPPVAVCITFVVTVAWWTTWIQINPRFAHSWVGSEICFARWSEFGSGMLAAYLATRPNSRPMRLPFLAAALAAAAAITVDPGLLRYGFWHDTFDFVPIVADTVAFGALIFQATQRGIAGKALAWRPLALLGVISYSVYLIHGSVFMLMSIFAAPAGTTRCWQYWLLGIPIAIAVAVPFHLRFERPFMTGIGREQPAPRPSPNFIA